MKKDREIRFGNDRVEVVSTWRNKRGQRVQWKWFIEGTMDHWIRPVRAKVLHWVASDKQAYERYFSRSWYGQSNSKDVQVWYGQQGQVITQQTLQTQIW